MRNEKIKQLTYLTILSFPVLIIVTLISIMLNIYSETYANDIDIDIDIDIESNKDLVHENTYTKDEYYSNNQAYLYIYDRPIYDHNMGSIVGREPEIKDSLVIENTKYFIDNVPNISQFPKYPTGCEAVALTQLLQWLGKDITVEQVIDHMPKGPKPYLKKGRLFAADPKEAFVGNPYDSAGSYGIYHQPLLEMLELYFPNKAVNLTGLPWDKIENHIKKGIPVVIWGTINAGKTKLTTIWEIPSGETFQWRNNQHAMTVVGFDDSFVYVNDPYTGKLGKYKKSQFIISWESMYSQAISIKH